MERGLGRSWGNGLETQSTGNVLAVGFLELFLRERVAVVPGASSCGTGCRAERGQVPTPGEWRGGREGR